MLANEAIELPGIKRPSPLVRFGPFLLDKDSRALTIQAKAVSIGPREFDLLNLFVQSSAQILTRDQIMLALWPKQNTKEGAITQAIYRLKRILHTHDRGERYIVAVPGRGYQFVCPVRVVKVAPLETRASASQNYRRAMHRRLLGSRSSVLQSIELFAASLTEDPAFPAALVGITEAYTTAAHLRLIEPRRAFAQARKYAGRALSIDPYSSDAHAVLGTIFLLCDRNRRAAYEFTRYALKLSPTSYYAQAAAIWEALARKDFIAAHMHANDLSRAAPGVADRTVLVGIAHYYSGMQEQAYSHLADALEIDPANERARQFALCSLCASGRYGDAERLLDRLQLVKRSAFGAAIRDYAAGRAGRSVDPAGFALYQRYPLLGAMVSLGCGRPMNAIQYFTRALSSHDPGLVFAPIDPLFANAREVPEAANFLDTI